MEEKYSKVCLLRHLRKTQNLDVPTVPTYRPSKLRTLLIYLGNLKKILTCEAERRLFRRRTKRTLLYVYVQFYLVWWGDVTNIKH